MTGISPHRQQSDLSQAAASGLRKPLGDGRGAGGGPGEYVAAACAYLEAPRQIRNMLMSH